MDYTDLGQGVYHLDALYIQPGVASLYGIVHNHEVAFIETGTAHTLPHVQQFLTDLSLSPEQVKYVIPTHVHLDHAGGAGVMMQAFPEARLVIHPRGARHMIDPSKLVAASKEVYGEKVFDQLYGAIPPINQDRVIVAEHGHQLMLNDRKLTFVDTPGHAYHHFCVVDQLSAGIFTGDTFGLSYPNLLYENSRFVIPTTTPTHFNPDLLHQSVDLLMSYQPQKMYMTHFSVLPEPAAFVDQYHEWIDHFVELAEEVKPKEESDLEIMIQKMGHKLAHSFDLSEHTIQNQLAMDIKLNCQGLAFWYQHRDG